MNPVLKSILLHMARFAPGLCNQLRAARQRRQIHRFEERLGLPAIARAYLERHKLEVVHGPFTGMQYVMFAAGSAFVPKLLGAYELELHPILQKILLEKHQLVIDIGCAEGYYAVGLARACPHSFVYAFDIDPHARGLCKELAQINGVADRVMIREACDPEQLKHLLKDGVKALIVCDCEGYEYDLLNPKDIPDMEFADLLIEMHEVQGYQTSKSSALEGFIHRFEATHHVVIIQAEDRHPEAYSELDFLPVEKRLLAISEFRNSGQQWLFMSAYRGRV